MNKIIEKATVLVEISSLFLLSAFGGVKGTPDPEITDIQPESGPPGADVRFPGQVSARRLPVIPSLV